MKLSDHYDSGFYQAQMDGSYQSGLELLSFLFSLYKPQSVIDIGCGRGAWLKAAKNLGAADIHGVDGPWLKQEDMLDDQIKFIDANMESTIPLSRRYDLAISLEVAEHLSSSAAPKIVSTLCDASDLVLFGAAVPCQGGENHINEQRQSYWVKLFCEQNFSPIDLVRPALWSNKLVSPWYKQNTLLYVRDSREDLKRLLQPGAIAYPIYDIIHPDMFEKRVVSLRGKLEKPSLQLTGSVIKCYLSNLLSWPKKRSDDIASL
jgi:methyltransferase family protein